jgi:hypothetical protein
MGKSFETSVLVAGALFCFATTWSSAAEPEKFAERLGLSVLNAGGLSEIRAQYSGFFLAVAAICTAALFGLVSRQVALAVLVVVFGGLLCGRIASLAINRGTSGFTRTIVSLYFIDSAGLALSGFALLANK